MISVKAYDKHENPERDDASTNWGWTNGIPVKVVGIYSVQSRSNKKSYCYKLLRIDKRLIESTVYIIIEKEDIQHPAYMIENNSKNISLMVYQENNEVSADYIDV
jgi:hypothetical protein